jgi:hypothetical protein
MSEHADGLISMLFIERRAGRMQIVKRMTLAVLLLALVLTGASTRGGSVVVNDDSGGGSLLTVTGTSTGATVVADSNEVSTSEVDGVTGLSLPTSYNFTITDVAVIVPGLLSITASGSTTIGTVTGSLATLDFTASGYAFNIGTTGYIDLTGTINTVPFNAYPGYNFSPSMVGAAITLEITKTSANYMEVLGHNGVVVGNSGFGFQQNDGAVPEPTSMTLLGIGLSAVLAFRRFHRPAAPVA